MSDEKKLTVEMTWTTTRTFTVAVPADTDEQEIEDILYDCAEEFRDLDHTPMPCIIDSEETLSVVELGLTEIEFQNADFEEIANG